MKSPLIIITGPTASGKTGGSLVVSDSFFVHTKNDSEIINADSRQIYKYMDIGTAKPSKEQQGHVTHHLIDIINPDETFTSAQWQTLAIDKIHALFDQGKQPIVVGGTGLYLDTLVYNFNLTQCPPQPALREKYEHMELNQPGICHMILSQVDPQQAQLFHPKAIRHIIRALEIFDTTGQTKSSLVTKRPPLWPIYLFILNPEKQILTERIHSRVEEMIKMGLIEEVQGLIQKGYIGHVGGMNCIGYREVCDFLDGLYSKEQMIEQINIHTVQFAKRQKTWFRRYIRDYDFLSQQGVSVYEVSCVEEIVNIVGSNFF